MAGSADRNAQAVARLDALTRRLRRECPWDREQDERSIVPHTVEEAYELAAAAYGDDDAKLLDELGDVLFQVHFLSLLLEERGAGSLADVAEHVRQKLIRRHPHIFGGRRGRPRRRGAAQLGRDQGDRAGARAGHLRRGAGEPARAAATRARCSAAPPRRASTSTTCPYEAVRAELDELEAADGRAERFHEVGDVLFAAVNVARKLKVDPELALRAVGRALPRPGAGRRGAGRIGRRGLGTIWAPTTQLAYYARARMAEEREP